MIKRAILAAVLLAIPSMASAQGIPVFDASSYLQNVQQVANTVRQIQQGVDMINQARDTYDSLSHTTNVANIAGILNDTNVSQVLPDGIDLSSLNSSSLSNLGNIGNLAKSISNPYSAVIFEGQTPEANTAYNNYLQNQNKGAAVNAAVAYNISNQTRAVDSGLDQLRQQISFAQDPKDVMDLQARATIENAKISNRMLQYQAMQQFNQSQAAMQLNAKTLNYRAASTATGYNLALDELKAAEKRKASRGN